MLAILAIAGCTEHFDPLVSSDETYSIAGHLDASADTQWIRVMPLRPLVFTEAGPFPGRVALEHIESGRIIELEDSVFRFEASAELGSEIRYVHNFWTTEPIEPGASYRFRAQQEGREAAEAVVAIPNDYELEVWLRRPNASGSDYLRISGIPDIAFVSASAFYFDSCGTATWRVASVIPQVATTEHLVPISRTVPKRQQCQGNPFVEHRELWVAGSGEPWPTSGGQAAGKGPSNITNALGYIGGVLTKTVPYEDCELASYATETHCKLSYGPEKATLKAIVRDKYCGMGGLPRAVIDLRELDRQPAGLTRIRKLQSNRDGTFQIGGLESGMRYRLTVFRDEIPDADVQEYETYTATLEFAPGETKAYTVPLEKGVSCGWTQ